METSLSNPATVLNEPYPSESELLDPEILAMIPASLAEEVRHRYKTLGNKYLTAQQHYDGRFINGMMFTSRIDNCLEEVVDAVFCVIGWLFKHRVDPTTYDFPPVGDNILKALCDIYTALKVEQINGTNS